MQPPTYSLNFVRSTLVASLLTFLAAKLNSTYCTNAFALRKTLCELTAYKNKSPDYTDVVN